MPPKPPAPAPAKRVRKSSGTTASAPASHTLESLLALPHDELAKYAYDLQTQLSTLQQSGGSGGEVWSDDKVAERAKKTRDVCAAEIKKQMKWQPSCKTGTTKWSYTGIVPHEDVFYKLFGFEKPKKAWKQKKIDMADFEGKIGYISNSIRYNNLRITGDGVKVHWDQEEKTFKLTGTYGL
ncbi:hypothetical protein D6D19_02633 [Aureobasidium pullulans]|uniref:Uncharacterized protein n=1 Tax=Aureobasidium pullulans TaxID=5580 RepID=A0A4S9ACE7_AURPU|nr:hypothetical protein D6D19_02633 [Aureobasidium pullulans]